MQRLLLGTRQNTPREAFTGTIVALYPAAGNQPLRIRTYTADNWHAALEWLAQGAPVDGLDAVEVAQEEEGGDSGSRRRRRLHG